MIVVLQACRGEILELPEEVRGDLGDALARLDAGHTLSMPLSRPMPVIGKRVHELRLKDRSAIYRVVYAIVKEGRIVIVHAFKKKSGATPRRNIELARKRLKEMQA